MPAIFGLMNGGDRPASSEGKTDDTPSRSSPPGGTRYRRSRYSPKRFDTSINSHICSHRFRFA
jgi:hypothetical protein